MLPRRKDRVHLTTTIHGYDSVRAFIVVDSDCLTNEAPVYRTSTKSTILQVDLPIGQVTTDRQNR